VQTRTLIYGAGTAGQALLWELRQNKSLMCRSLASLIRSVEGLLDLAGFTCARTEKPSPGGANARYQASADSGSLPTGPQMVRILSWPLMPGGVQDGAGFGRLIQARSLGKQIGMSPSKTSSAEAGHLDQESIRERIEERL